LLPGDFRTDCPVTAEPGGPYVLPPNLLLQQTNAQGETGGPSLDPFAYYIFPEGKFRVCAQGNGTAENSGGGKSCPE
jgi:hypothetical protein